MQHKSYNMSKLSSHLCVCVCVCVCKTERDKQVDWLTGRKTECLSDGDVA